MKHLLTSLILFALLSCEHNIPIANLEFNKVEKNQKYKNSYFLYFSSDIELIDNLSNKHTGARLKCFFNRKIDDKDFTKNNGYTLSSVQDLQKITSDYLPSSNSNLYHYSVKVRFTGEKEGSTAETLGEREREKEPEILKLLNTKPACLNCVVTAVTFMSTTNRYVSNTMCLPKKELKNVIE